MQLYCRTHLFILEIAGKRCSQVCSDSRQIPRNNVGLDVEHCQKMSAVGLIYTWCLTLTRRGDCWEMCEWGWHPVDHMTQSILPLITVMWPVNPCEHWLKYRQTEQHMRPLNECKHCSCSLSLLLKILSFFPFHFFAACLSQLCGEGLDLDAEFCVQFLEMCTWNRTLIQLMKEMVRFLSVFNLCDCHRMFMIPFLTPFFFPASFRPNPNPTCLLISVWPSWHRQGHLNVSFPGMWSFSTNWNH